MDQFENQLFSLGIMLGILLLTVVVAYLLNRFFKRLILRSTEEINNDPTNYQFLRHSLTALIYIVGISIAIYSMPNLRTLAKSLLAGAGILAVAVGFASQHALSNIISGVFIVIFKPFRINDRISIRSLNGIIEDITLRHVVIRDFENKRIIIPNALISNEIIVNSNFEDESICKWIEVGISYESDIDLAKEIIARCIEQHPLSIDHRTEEEKEEGLPRVDVKVIGLGEYAVQLKGWAWAANPPDAFEMGCDLFEQLKKEFDKAGIEIPYPHRTIVNKPYGKRQASDAADQ